MKEKGKGNPPPPDRRCRAKRSDGSGRQCKKWAIRGGVTCASHGSAEGTPARKAARERLAELVDPALTAMSRALERVDKNPGIELHPSVVRVAGMVLDRAGYGPSAKVEVEEYGSNDWLEYATAAEKRLILQVMDRAERRKAGETVPSLAPPGSGNGAGRAPRRPVPGRETTATTQEPDEVTL